MPGRTSGTRPKGTNGPAKGPGVGGPAREGWGGPPQGAGAPRIDIGEYGDMVRALARDPTHLEAKALGRELYLTTLVDVMLTGETGATRAMAADRFGDRLDGKAQQRQEVTLRNVNPADMTDEELATIAAGRGQPSAASEEDQG